MFNFLRRKKEPTPPTIITVEEFVSDGWQANVDNGLCYVYGYFGRSEPRGSDMIERIELHDSGSYRLIFVNHESDWLALPDARLDIIYRQYNPSQLPDDARTANRPSTPPPQPSMPTIK